MINWKKVFHMLCAIMPQLRCHWFFCFGTMLTIVRDGGRFEGIDDVDIGAFFEEFHEDYIKHICELCGLQVDRRIVHDVTKQPLFVSMVPKPDCATDLGDVHIDLFLWYKHKGKRFHTYDVNFEKPKNGIPKKYIFKGIDAELLEKTVKVENMADSMMEGTIPLKYGTLLDDWYPHWLQKRQGVSFAPYEISMKSCRQLQENTYKKVTWRESV